MEKETKMRPGQGYEHIPEEIKVGDVVVLKTSSEIQMVVGCICGNNTDCYFYKGDGVETVQIPVSCLKRFGG